MDSDSSIREWFQDKTLYITDNRRVETIGPHAVAKRLDPSVVGYKRLQQAHLWLDERTDDRFKSTDIKESRKKYQKGPPDELEDVRKVAERSTTVQSGILNNVVKPAVDNEILRPFEKALSRTLSLLKMVAILHERDLRSQEQIASSGRRLAEYKRQIDTLTQHRQELTASLDKERKRHRVEMERTTEDYAMMRSDRDHYKAQTEMQEIEMKRFKKANVEDTAKVSDKENRNALEVVGASPSVAQKKRMKPRESRPTPVLTVRRQPHPDPSPVLLERSGTSKILALETLPGS
ncbi:hypothetical protein NCC49_004368 [Naganishia albida]|nr:hypothetical protein NCC49_004368 [Naganishia albida]